MSRCSHSSLSVRPSCACKRSSSLRRLGSARALNSTSVSWCSAMFHTQVMTCLNDRQVEPCMSSTSQRSQLGPSKRGRFEGLALLVHRLRYGDASALGFCRNLSPPSKPSSPYSPPYFHPCPSHISLPS